MATRAIVSQGTRRSLPECSDEQLVRDCIRGDEHAWAALIGRYKNLIYSIPLKYNLGREDANDIFQAVCVDLLHELPRLREPRALPAWLMRITAHKCFHWKRQAQRSVSQEDLPESRPPVAPEVPADQVLQAVREEQMLREALAALPPRCRELVQMLFFEHPPRPYATIARELGLATGSIGFIRRRCLTHLRRILQEKGFE